MRAAAEVRNRFAVSTYNLEFSLQALPAGSLLADAAFLGSESRGICRAFTHVDKTSSLERWP